MFKLTRLCTDANGDSQFEDQEIALSSSGDIGPLSDLFPASGLVFRKVLPTYHYDFHTAPQKQYVVLLDGAIEIETSLGEKRVGSHRGVSPRCCHR